MSNEENQLGGLYAAASMHQETAQKALERLQAATDIATKAADRLSRLEAVLNGLPAEIKSKAGAALAFEAKTALSEALKQASNEVVASARPAVDLAAVQFKTDAEMAAATARQVVATAAKHVNHLTWLTQAWMFCLGLAVGSAGAGGAVLYFYKPYVELDARAVAQAIYGSCRR